MTGLVWDEPPGALGLVDPIVLCALEGWFDVGETATGALEWLRGRFDAVAVGHIDAERYVNFGRHRPRIRYDEDGIFRSLTWPHTAVQVARTRARRDLVLLAGPEPDVRWRGYTDDVIAVARTVGAGLVVTLGAALAPVPHTRPPKVTASASSADLAHRLGLALPSYQGVTGVIGVLQEALGRRGVAGISLRVPAPHYLGSSTNPPGTQALLQRLEQLLGVPTGWEDLSAAARAWRDRVDQAVAADEDAVGVVRQLEVAYDHASAPDWDAERMMSDLEQYLRASGEEPDGGTA